MTCGTEGDRIACDCSAGSDAYGTGSAMLAFSSGGPPVKPPAPVKPTPPRLLDNDDDDDDSGPGPLPDKGPDPGLLNIPPETGSSSSAAPLLLGLAALWWFSRQQR